MLTARAIQMFMPGKPQIWYLDLFAGKNDYEAMKRAGVGGHKEINRSNLSLEDAEALLNEEVVKEQLELLRFRNTCPVFTEDADIKVECNGSLLEICWQNAAGKVALKADLANDTYEIEKEY